VKLLNVIFDAATGVLDQCRDTSVGLAKIQLAGYYLRIVSVLRRKNLLYVLVIVGAMMAVNILMILEIAILFFSPFSSVEKILLAVLVGLIGSGAILFVTLQFFSQERWMRLTGADRLVADAMK